MDVCDKFIARVEDSLDCFRIYTALVLCCCYFWVSGPGRSEFVRIRCFEKNSETTLCLEFFQNLSEFPHAEFHPKFPHQNFRIQNFSSEFSHPNFHIRNFLIRNFSSEFLYSNFYIGISSSETLHPNFLIWNFFIRNFPSEFLHPNFLIRVSSSEISSSEFPHPKFPYPKYSNLNFLIRNFSPECPHPNFLIQTPSPEMRPNLISPKTSQIGSPHPKNVRNLNPTRKRNLLSKGDYRKAQIHPRHPTDCRSFSFKMLTKKHDDVWPAMWKMPTQLNE